MSREAYVAPTLQPQASLAAISDPTTQYLCGECNSRVQLKKGDPVRCKDCGHRVLYKERTKRYTDSVEPGVFDIGTNPSRYRMVQFEAR